jgi:predicted dinucleotide-binding enzyme
MNIGIIGSGEMGTCLASKFVKGGHTVSMANSRGPASLRQLARDIGIEAATIEEATMNKKVIIVAIHQKNVQDLSKRLFAGLPDDVVVIDTGNYFPNLRGGPIPGLDKNGVDSQWVQAQLCVPIVKVFNSILATSLNDLGRASGEKGRIAIPVSGDKPAAKRVAFRLVEELGFDPFDLGNIARSWRQQPGSSIYCRHIGLEELKKRVDAIRSGRTDTLEKVIAKRKTNEVLMRTDYPAYLESLRD